MGGVASRFRVASGFRAVVDPDVLLPIALGIEGRIAQAALILARFFDLWHDRAPFPFSMKSFAAPLESIDGHCPTTSKTRAMMILFSLRCSRAAISRTFLFRSGSRTRLQNWSANTS